jgi:hypothetical protein
LVAAISGGFRTLVAPPAEIQSCGTFPLLGIDKCDPSVPIQDSGKLWIWAELALKTQYLKCKGIKTFLSVLLGMINGQLGILQVLVKHLHPTRLTRVLLLVP